MVANRASSYLKITRLAKLESRGLQYRFRQTAHDGSLARRPPAANFTTLDAYTGTLDVSVYGSCNGTVNPGLPFIFLAL